MTNNPKPTMTASKMAATHISISKVALKRAIEEIIGKDENLSEHLAGLNEGVKYRNLLRVQQRRRLAQWLGEEAA